MNDTGNDYPSCYSCIGYIGTPEQVAYAATGYDDPDFRQQVDPQPIYQEIPPTQLAAEIIEPGKWIIHHIIQ